VKVGECDVYLFIYLVKNLRKEEKYLFGQESIKLGENYLPGD
jgi:hypothetical protein